MPGAPVLLDDFVINLAGARAIGMHGVFVGDDAGPALAAPANATSTRAARPRPAKPSDISCNMSVSFSKCQTPGSKAGRWKCRIRRELFRLL